MKFNFFRRLKLQTKMLFVIITTVLVVYASVIVYMTIRLRTLKVKNASDYALAEAKQHANFCKLEFENALSTARTLAATIEGSMKANKKDRQVLQEQLLQILLKNTDFVSVWTIFEPNHFDSLDYKFANTYGCDKNGRFVSTWLRYKDSLKLTVCENYDVPGTGNYYMIPKRTGEEVITEPYLFYFNKLKGEQTLITSLCIPILFQKRFVGVVGINISLEKIQTENDKIVTAYSGYGKLISHGGFEAANFQKSRIGKFTDEYNTGYSKTLQDSIESGTEFRAVEKSVEYNQEAIKAFVPITIGNTTSPWSFGIIIPMPKLMYEANVNLIIIVFAGILSLLMIAYVIYLSVRFITSRIGKVTHTLTHIASGKFTESDFLIIDTEDELAEMDNACNTMMKNIAKMTAYAKQIGAGNLNVDFQFENIDNEMGRTLFEMHKSLKKASEDEQKHNEMERQQSWFDSGVAKFSELVRLQTSDQNELIYEILHLLVKYVDINQGAIFILNDDVQDDIYLEIVASHAYNRRKYLEQKIHFGEGLIGTCAVEKKIIYLTKIPDDYIQITSGLGHAVPKAIFIVPLKIDDEIYGVLELASFEEFTAFQRQFIEKIAEIIASTISNGRVHIKTQMLLNQSHEKSEMLAAQEEEMRQNLEELMAIQEAAARKEAELNKYLKQFKQQEEEYKNRISRLEIELNYLKSK